MINTPQPLIMNIRSKRAYRLGTIFSTRGLEVFVVHWREGIPCGDLQMPVEFEIFHLSTIQNRWSSRNGPKLRLHTPHDAFDIRHVARERI